MCCIGAFRRRCGIASPEVSVGIRTGYGCGKVGKQTADGQVDSGSIRNTLSIYKHTHRGTVQAIVDTKRTMEGLEDVVKVHADCPRAVNCLPSCKGYISERPFLGGRLRGQFRE